ncbi:type IV pilus modification PilV family protein [Coraliomargarita parva]|uniref:type IV pilus modification PilV family protein n=1 Tax=Coraliomargarita parva TaxID=3014050 RepID=UPI0022B37030|nr:prepilin-type N-terminal cleavage/methylation domain-containing protein [Coraliomargarita parva]
MLPRLQAKAKDGFTLLELLIALFIFALVMISGFGCLRMGMNQVDNARHETRASQIMQSEIERLRSLAWANLISMPSTEETVDLSTHFSELSNTAYTNYTLKRLVSGSGNSRKITLTISWTDIAGRDHSKIYVTQYAKGGIYDYIQ